MAFLKRMKFNFWPINDKCGHYFKKRCHKPNHQLRLTVDYAVFHPGRSLLEILKLGQIFLNFFEVTHDYIISLFVKMHGEVLFDFLIVHKKFNLFDFLYTRCHKFIMHRFQVENCANRHYVCNYCLWKHSSQLPPTCVLG